MCPPGGSRSSRGTPIGAHLGPAWAPAGFSVIRTVRAPQNTPMIMEESEPSGRSPGALVGPSRGIRDAILMSSWVILVVSRGF
eukprot:7063039-Pyramimonas_sp.AAC.1